MPKNIQNIDIDSTEVCAYQYCYFIELIKKVNQNVYIKKYKKNKSVMLISKISCNDYLPNDYYQFITIFSNKEEVVIREVVAAVVP